MKQNIWAELYSQQSAHPANIVIHEMVDFAITSVITLPADPVTDRIIKRVFLHAVAEAPLLRTIYIVKGFSVVMSKPKLTDIGDFMTANAVNIRTVAVALRRKANFSRIVSEMVAASLSDCIETYDNTALFLDIALIEETLRMIETLGNHAHRGNAPAGGLVYLNAAQDGNAGALVGTIFQEVVNERRFCFRFRDLKDADISLIDALTTGCQSIQPAQGDLVPISSIYRSEGSIFCIWDDMDRAAPAGGYAALHAGGVRESGIRIANMLGERDAYVKGYTRAASLINGCLSNEVVNRVEYQRFFTAGFETLEISLPAARGTNFLWHLLGIKSSAPVESRFMDEWSVLSNLNVAEVAMIGTAVGALFSLGISAVFHVYNITGREINQWAGAGGMNHNASAYVTSTLFTSEREGVPITLFRQGCAAIPQFSAVSLSADCFPGTTFCNGLRGWNQCPETILWLGHFHRRIPYLIQPYTFQWVLEKWLSLWAITSPGVAFDFSHDLHKKGGAARECIDFSSGESRYKDVAACRHPFIWVPYGQLALNVIQAHFRSVEHHQIVWRMIYTNTAHVSAELLVDADIQPNYVDNLFTTEVGSVITYDWEARAVLAPVLMRNHTPVNIWQSLQDMGSKNSQFAGIPLRTDLGVFDLNTGADAVAAKPDDAPGSDAGPKP